MNKLLVALTLLLFSFTAQAAPWTTAIESVPEMVNPLIVNNVCPGESGWPTDAQMAGRDVKFVLPTDRDCTFKPDTENKVNFIIGGTQSNPARNIWWVGGKILAPAPYPQTDPGTMSWPNGLTLKFVKGTAYFEGLHADMRCTCRDVIAAANLGHYEGGTLTGNQPADKTPRIVVVNSILENPLQCTQDPSIHGDVIHSQGSGTRPEVKLQNVVFRHGFQGLFLDNSSGQPAGHGATRIELDHVQIYKRSEVSCQRTEGKAGTTGSVMWNVAPRDGVWFNKVWAVKGATTNPGFTLVDNCATYPSSAGVKKSDWCQGTNPDGDPVTPATVGRNYKRSNFTTDAPPDPDPDPPPTTTPNTNNRVFIKAGHARLNAALSSKFLTGAAGAQVVAYSYREHNKAAPAASTDLCKATGISWPAETQDVIYITSELAEPSELEVTVGTSPAVVISLPANQASSGQQSVVPIADKVGEVRFNLKRNGTSIKTWAGKLVVTGAPVQRTTSTYSDAEVISTAPVEPKLWLEPVSLDRAEGNTGLTDFVARVKRNVTTGSVSTLCRIKAAGATASDFDGGVLPEALMTITDGQTETLFTAKAIGDTTQETDEGFTVECETPSPSTYTASNVKLNGVIRNDDAPAGAPRFVITALDQSIIEGTSQTPTTQRFEVSRLGDVSGRTDSVDFCPQPNATGINSASSSDFAGGWAPRAVTFAPGDPVTKSVDMSVNADSVPEPNESYSVLLRYSTPGTVIETGSADAVIINDDGTGNAKGARINAGQTADDPYVDQSGQFWSKDIGTGGATDTNDFSFGNTQDQFIFRSYRYGASTYQITVEPGYYRVTGLFSEPDTANDGVDCEVAKGKRLMQTTVSATGGDSVSKQDIDPYCGAGFRTAYFYELGKVNAPQGKLKVDVRAASGSASVALINGLMIEPVTQPVVARQSDWLNFGAAEATSYTDSAGNAWRVPDASLVTGCTSVVDAEKQDIAGTGDDMLFWSRCVGGDINVSVPIDASNNNKRAVNLLFSEPTAGAGSRVFDVYVNGVKQITGLDVSQVSGIRTALTRTVSPATVGDDGRINVRILSTTSNPAIINAMSITNVQTDNTMSVSMGWRGKLRINKRDIVKAVSSTGLSANGNPLVVRRLDTTTSDVYACHGACDSTATKGLQPDTDASKQKLFIELMAHLPTDTSTSVFAGLKPRENANTTLTAVVAELLSDGSTGSESTVTINVSAKRAM